jgi:hypothetical protein
MALDITVVDDETGERFDGSIPDSEDFHNAIVHPMLVAYRPLGEWLHAHTEPG